MWAEAAVLGGNIFLVLYKPVTAWGSEGTHCPAPGLGFMEKEMDVCGVPVVGQALALMFFLLIFTSTHKIGGSLLISWMKNIWHREVNELAQSHTAHLEGMGSSPPAGWL